MNRDHIIRLADAAGIPGWDDTELLTEDMLLIFASLVASAEREACAKVCDGVLEKARDESAHIPHNTNGIRLGAAACGAAIRSRMGE